jgi:glycosyltransferase involved in cell wall biosynthesis
VNVLILHNRYREPGGEERSVAEIQALLRERGHSVELLERSSSTSGRSQAGRALLRGGLDPEGVADAIRAHGAELVHAHNINPLFGPRALAAARSAGARVVMHLHNYRLVCAVATTYRDGAPCTLCHGRKTLPGLSHRCRGGVAESAAYAAGIARAQRRVLAAVDRFAVPSAAARDRLGTLSLPTDRMQVLPNFLREDEFAARSVAGEGAYALFAGRLVEEKGADLAIEACARANVPLVIAGDGPDAGRLHGLAAQLGAKVRFTGHVDARDMADLREGAAFALAPSRWDEPCPYTVIEAMAAGLPVIASDLGGLPEMVGAEHVLTSTDGNAWSEAIAGLWSDSQRRADSGAQALDRARELFGVERFYSGLMELYGNA